MMGTCRPLVRGTYPHRYISRPFPKLIQYSGRHEIVTELETYRLYESSIACRAIDHGDGAAIPNVHI